MAAFFVVNPGFAFMSGDVLVTCAGTVKAPHGAAIRRRIYVYRDGDQTAFLAATASDPTLGTFSVQVPGHAASEFCVICKGDAGENDGVYANANLNGTGPTGLYIAPALNSLPFVIGPGEVTSPWIDVVFPVPVVEAEGEVEIVAWGEIVIPVVIEAEGVTTIICDGDVNFGFASTYGTADVFYDTNAAPQIPMWQVAGESLDNIIFAHGAVRLPSLRVNAVQSDNGSVVFPAAIVEALALNPIVCHGDVSMPSAVAVSVGNTGGVSWGDVNLTTPAADGFAVRHDIHFGAVDVPSWVVAGTAHVEAVAIGSVSFRPAHVAGIAASPLWFENPCDAGGSVA